MNYEVHEDISDMSLTERQKEILFLFSMGMIYTEVARYLGISHHTVKNHVSSRSHRCILRRLNANTITHAVAIAIRNELIS